MGQKFREYTGANYLRQRLVLSTLTGKPIKITKIRHREDDPGIKEAEAGFIRLMDKLTNGSRIEVSETGTTLMYQPGVLIGGKIEHDCSLERGIGYTLEPLLAMGPFCKNPLHVTLKGITNNEIDPSVDLVKASGLPVLKRFLLIDDGLELKIQKRGVAPGGGGQVLFKCPVRKQIRPIQVTDQGKIKRIRGVAWAVRVSPAVANRVVEAAKGPLLKFLPDIYIYTDHYTGANSGKSPGFGLTLTAETTTGAFLSADICSSPPGGSPTVPEDLGAEGARRLLEEVYRGGCVDSSMQALSVLLMSLGPADVSKCVMGPLSPYTVKFLRHTRDFLDLIFKLETYCPPDKAEEDDLKMGAEKVELTCVGVGYTNLSKRTT